MKSQRAEVTGAAVSEWRAGWPVVVAAAFGVAATTIPSFTLGALMKPITSEFGWSRTQYSAGFTFVTLMILIGSPLIGGAIDRFGARRIAVPAMVLCCTAFAGLALAGPSLTSWYIGMAFVGLGLSASGAQAWMPPVAARFNQARAFAISVALMGFALAQVAAPIMATVYLARFGTRGVFPAVALTTLAVALPVVLLFFFDEKDLGRRRKSPAYDARSMSAKYAVGLTLKEALATTRFWRLAIAMLLITGGTGSISLHAIPMLTDNGMTPWMAAAALSVLGPATSVGRLGCGVLLDRFPAPVVAAAAFSLGAVGYLLLGWVGDSFWFAAGCLALVGLVSGAEVDMAAYAVSRYFGIRSFGAIYGVLIGLASFAYGTVPVLVGLARDRSHSYHTAMVLLAGLVAISAVLAATLGRYPTFESRQPAIEPATPQQPGS